MKLKQLILMSFVLIFAFSCSTRHKSSKTETPIVQAPKEKPQQKIHIEEIYFDDSMAEIEAQIVDDILNSDTPVRVDLPEVKREFRAAWIASVANINWPSKRGLSTEQQKSEAIALLDMLKENNFNAVILQVRPSADAFYNSRFEPWSVFLNGETGDAPRPYYDPLEFWIEEAHKRGLELHAWLNPYRAHHSNGGAPNSSSMIYKMPKQIVKLKNGMYWFDPSQKETQDHVSKVVMDIVKRYDVDGIHFDDYFYPYASYNGGADFPDQPSWNDYVKSGGKLSRADWRRENVNVFIQRIYTEIKTEKNWVKFGISPFGIWKPGYPSSVAGMSQYDELYADAKLWLNKGWIDYFTPQLYWPIDAPKQGFEDLLYWWKSENTFDRHLWPGLNTVEVKVSDRPKEILRQIESTRRIIPDDTGVVHWSIGGLNQRMLNELKKGPYSEKVAIPKSDWLNPLTTVKPRLNVENSAGNVIINWTFSQSREIREWVVFYRYGDKWETEILDLNVTQREVPKFKDGKKLILVAVRGIERTGNNSDYDAKLVK